MSSSNRSNAVLPDTLKQVLEMRKSTNLKCRPDVEAAMTRYGLVRTTTTTTVRPTAVGSVAAIVRPAPTAPIATPTPTSRFANLGQSAAPDGWRSKTVRAEDEDKWVSVSSSKKRSDRSGGGSGSFRRGEGYHNNGSHSNNNHSHSHNSFGTKSFHATSSSAPITPTTPTPLPSATPESGVASASASTSAAAGAGAWRSSRYQPLAETMEDRIMGKVRAKVNKLGHSTYDATKAFMKQILDSGETDFLEEFMRFVFNKAATESSFCGLYARFLHELADEFSHLRDAMVRKFREYTRVFDEASKAPDVGTQDYAAFVEAQEQKKFRRGYSQFVAELAKLGEVTTEDFRLLVNQIVETIRISYEKEESRQMCEEVIDCFLTMVRAVKIGWMREHVDALRSIVGTDKAKAPGLSNKGRFALMDILDLVSKISSSS